MDVKLLPCPICYHPKFQGVDVLRTTLIRVATCALSCPVCNEILVGLDKLTIHLFTHINNVTLVNPAINQNIANNQHNHINQERVVSIVPAQSLNRIQTVTLVNQTPNNQNQNVIISPQNTTVKVNKNVSLQSLNQNDVNTNSTSQNNIVTLNQDVVIADTSEKANMVVDHHLQELQTENKRLSEEKSEKQFRCDICNFSFNDENILDMHQNLLHQTSVDKKTGTYSYHCHLCTKKFKMRGSLMVHLRVAHYGFVNHIEESNLQSITNTNKPNNKQENTVVIQKGNQEFNNASFANNDGVSQLDKTDTSLEEPVKSPIKDNKQWECDVCSKMFTTKYFLKKHKRLHTGEMPYFCNLCNKSFTFQQSYHKHMLYHTTEKPHVCNECGRAFKELSTLHNHERIHSGERPFACETCGKCFRQRVSYLVHRRIHTGVMPYKCTACEKSFRYKVSQRSHKCTANPPGTVIRAVEGQNTTIEPPNTTTKAPQNDSYITSNLDVSNLKLVDDKMAVDVKLQVANDNRVVDVSKAVVFNVNGQSYSFVPGCEIIAIPMVHNTTCENTDANVQSNNVLHSINNGNHGVGGIDVEKTSSIQSSLHIDTNDNSNPSNFDTPDFFSMVMSNSPTSLPDVQNLHINSPKKMEIEQNNEKNLETINEESLKELLYGPRQS